MMITKKRLVIAALIAPLVGVVGLVIYAQQQVQVQPGKGIAVKGIEIEVQQTPEFQAANVRGKKIDNPRDWVEIEVEFDVDGVNPRDAVIPELIFRYYVGIRDQQNQAVVLTGDVVHVNVVGGESYYSAAYVAPSTLGKFTGDFKRFEAGKVQAVGVEIYYNGVLVGGGLEKVNAKFWEQIAPQPGVLSRQDTPFSLLWIDRYADEKNK
ncbi:MAG: hypothetical protein HKN23_21025 [Verrucomicrobiales bacterium]|nr:hypothetical protein [Verrucomicrobiales bacterium]